MSNSLIQKPNCFVLKSHLLTQLYKLKSVLNKPWYSDLAGTSGIRCTFFLRHYRENCCKWTVMWVLHRTNPPLAPLCLLQGQQIRAHSLFWYIKVWLASSHTRLFPCCLWLPHKRHSPAVVTETLEPAKLKILIIWPFTEKVCQCWVHLGKP